MNRKEIALKLWHERQQEQLSYIAMVLDNRDYKHNVHEVKEFKTSKIKASDGNHALSFFLTDDSITFPDSSPHSDLCLPIEQFSLWLDT